jgi:hypothetical protein
MTAITRDSGNLPSLTSQCDQRVNLRYPARGHVTGGKADGCGSGFWGEIHASSIVSTVTRFTIHSPF